MSLYEFHSLLKVLLIIYLHNDIVIDITTFKILYYNTTYLL